jgi:hypothetical protein
VAAISIFWISFGLAAEAQRITMMVSPFDSASTGNVEIGKKTGIILNLQIWQTLRIPTTAVGRKTHGAITWDVTSNPPTSYSEAESLAGRQAEDTPQLVLWGRAWRYGPGTVVEAFLLIRADVSGSPGQNVWSVPAPDGSTISVTLPRQQIDFSPIILRNDILPLLEQPSGLVLYSSPHGSSSKGTVGNYFRALEQSPDSAKVALPNGTVGWIRLPNLSSARSEVVDFSGGVMRILRDDWPGAVVLFTKVINNPHTPAAVLVDAYLYLALASAQMGQNSYEWTAKAYGLSPYSKTVVQYLCMSRMSDFDQLTQDDKSGDRGSALLNSLNSLIDHSSALFPTGDAWARKVKQFVFENRRRNERDN